MDEQSYHVIYFVINYVTALEITNAGFYFLICLVGLSYLLFCLYLTFEMVIQMGYGEGISRLPIIGKLFMPLEFYHDLQNNDHLEDGMGIVLRKCPIKMY